MRVSYRPLILAAQLMTLFVLHLPSAQAGNMSFLNDAPMGKFTDEDLRLMNDNLDTAMADTTVRKVHSWSNASTGHAGTAEILQAFTGPNDVPCKRVRIINRAGKLTGKSQYTLCKMNGQAWSLVPTDYAPQPKQNPKDK